MKIDRLVSIIMILLEKERVGAQELAEMFDPPLSKSGANHRLKRLVEIAKEL